MNLRLLTDDELYQGTALPRPASLPVEGSTLPVGGSGEGGDTSLGIFGTAWDAVKGVGAGAIRATEETLNFGRDVLNLFDDALGIDVISNDPEDEFDFSGYEPTVQSGLGEFTRSVSQFLTGFAIAGKVMAPVKVLKAGGLARSMVQGAIADVIAFDPHEARFANLLDRFPSLQNPVVDYLKADPSDGNIEGRLKNALEGLALGAITDSLFAFVRGYKKYKAGKITANELQDAVADSLPPPSGGQAVTGAVDDVLVEGGTARPAATKPGWVPYEDVDGLVEGVQKGQQKAIKAKIKPTIPSSEELLDAVQEFKKTGGPIDPYNSSQILNLDNIDSIPEALRYDEVFRATNDLLIKAIGPEVNPVTFTEAYSEALRRQAVLSELPHEELVAAFRGLVADGRGVEAIDLLTVGNIMQKASLDVTNMLRTFNDATATVAEKARILQRLELFKEAALTYKVGTMRAARAVTYHRILHSSYFKEGLTQDVLQNALERIGSMKEIDVFLNRLKLATSPEQVAKIVNRVGNEGNMLTKLIHAHNEYWMNSVLSGPVTHVVNLTSNTLNTLVLPAEKVIGGLRGGDQELMREGLRTYLGFAHVLGDAWKMAKLSFRLDDNLIKPALEGIADQTARNVGFKAISGEALGADGVLGKGITFLGKILNLPSRLLLAGDEFFSQLMYRGTLYAKLYNTGVSQGIVDARALREFIQTNMEKAFTPRVLLDGTTVQGGGMVEALLREAREVTFTQELERGIGKSLSSFLTKHPALKPIAPFVRTPTNIFRNVWQKTPVLNKLQFQFRRMLKGGDPEYLKELFKTGGQKAVDAAVRDYNIAMGRSAIGGMFWATAAIAAMSGRLTGSGPHDARARKILLETGWQPYSIKIGDTYISYSRMDPFGMFFGIAADFADLAPDMEEDDLMSTGATMVASLVRNLSSKTYLRGMVEAMNALTGDERGLDLWLTRQAATYLPFSSLNTQIRNAIDPEYRELQGLMDYFKDKIPGISSTLPSRNSWITGEPLTRPENMWVLPTPWRKKENDFVLDELANLGYGFSGPPGVIDGVRLTTSQISDYHRLHGTVKIGGKTMLQALERVMKTSRYDIERAKYPDSPDGLTSRRLVLIQDVIARYRKAAKGELMKLYPDLKGQVLQNRVNTRLARSGDARKLAQIVR